MNLESKNEASLPTENVNALCIVFQWRQFTAQDLKGLQDLAILQVFQVLLLQQQKLHPLT